MIADTMSDVPSDVTDAIRTNNAIDDPSLAALHDFTHHLLLTQGRPSNDAVTKFLNADYNEKQILAIILAISVKILSNYTNHIFDTDVDAMFQSRVWQK